MPHVFSLHSIMHFQHSRLVQPILQTTLVMVLTTPTLYTLRLPGITIPVGKFASYFKNLSPCLSCEENTDILNTFLVG